MKKRPAFVIQEKEYQDKDNSDAGDDFNRQELVFKQAKDNAGILAVNNLKRHALFPEIPTIAEAGFPNPNPILDWRALAAPKGVPEDQMKILVEGFKKCFDDPEFRKLADELGLPLVYRDPKGLEEFLAGMEKTLEPALESVGLLKSK